MNTYNNNVEAADIKEIEVNEENRKCPKNPASLFFDPTNNQDFVQLTRSH